MSYQVLARKWRPRVFSEMVGQEHVLQALINALDRDRLHHAYLFTGTRGVGKTTIARILAKCLNCEAGVSSVPCGECSACTNIAAGRFVDLIEVDAASRTKVEDTRELLDNVQYAPTQGRYKVYLIDEVHMLSSHSFNALLKTLEEPPPHVKFLLATTDPHKLPVTILSRCLQFNLKNLGPERIVQHLQHVLTEEHVPFEEAALWSLGRAADGSMRDALSLADQAIGHGGGKISSADVSDMLGSIDRSVVIRICQALADRDALQALKLVESLAEQAPDYNQALAEMLSVWHRVAIAQTAPDALDNSHSDHGEVLALAQKLPPEDVQLFYQITLLGRRDLPMAAEPRSGFEMTLLRQLAFQPVTGQGINPPTAAAGTDMAAGVPVSAKKPEPTSAPRAQAPGSTAVLGPSRSSEWISDPVADAGGDSGTAAAKPSARAQPVSVSIPERLPEATPIARPEPRPAPAGNSRVVPGNLRGSEASCAKASPEKAAVVKPASRKQPPGNTGLAAAPATAREQSPAMPVALDCLQPEQWVEVYRQLAIGGVLQNTAANLVLTERRDNRLSFVLDKKYSSLFDHSHGARLASALSDYFAEAVDVSIDVGTVRAETPRACSLRLKAERRAQAIQSLYDDANVQQIISLFDGKLLEQTVEPKD